MFSDTHPDAERVQIELLRRQTGAQRIAKTRSLTSLAVRLSRRAIARANPGMTPREVEMRWVELNYGKTIANNLRTHWRTR